MIPSVVKIQAVLRFMNKARDHVADTGVALDVYWSRPQNNVATTASENTSQKYD
jgi:hypothetical protein